VRLFRPAGITSRRGAEGAERRKSSRKGAKLAKRFGSEKAGMTDLRFET
jgi:hypothetical protein